MSKKMVTLGRLEGVVRRRPRDRGELGDWLSGVLDFQVPEVGVCGHHQTPLDYLAHSFFEEKGSEADAVVWACRGGGKTTVGAVATLLDLLFKPKVEVRILGGSLEQSEKMYAYLLKMVDGHFRDLLDGVPTQRRLKLLNGSQVEILAQSDRSVRGTRVQKLRCDEVELFDEGVWQAAQLTTKSVPGVRGRPAVRGALESFSTMHRPGGLMQGILEGSQKSVDGSRKGGGGRRVFAWCIWDVIEKCAESRKCEGCSLWEECGGRAKGANGFVKVEDVITMKSRVSKGTWDHEMLCHPPRFENAVFPAFRREKHVVAAGEGIVKGGVVQRNGVDYFVESIIAGVDFGYVGAFVCLWMAMLREAGGLKRRAVWVLDEMVTREMTVSRNAAGMAGRKWKPEVVYCDVAGNQANSQTGVCDERVLREKGFVTKGSYMPIDVGIGVIEELLDPAEGAARLWIDPKCERLIGAFEGYQRRRDGKAEKDGVHDHLMDALRYAVVGYDRRGGKVEVVSY